MAVKEINARSWEREVMKNRNPVVVNFGHKDCKWCRKLNTIYSSLSKELDEAKFTRLDIRRSKSGLEIAKKYSVMGTPTLMIFCRGHPIGTIIGFREKDQLSKELAQFIRMAQDYLNTSTSMMYR
jgi:thioredoxin 1